VRKILQSQKTFANHLDDHEAMLALAENNPAANTNPSRAPPAPPTNTTTKRSTAPNKSSKLTASASKLDDPDVEMTDVLPPVLPPYTKDPPAVHTGDTNPLLMSRVPPIPTDEELRKLLAAPPLSYIEARAGWSEEDRRYPIRYFCEVCGYWGRVKCVKCGTRVCALDCLETHREECVTRYGL
jgi:zinc finger HIT domain-containing protein 1